MAEETGMSTDRKAPPLYKSSGLYKGFAYLFSAIFIAIGLIAFPSDLLFGLPFIFIGGAHIFLLVRYVADIQVFPSFLRISGVSRKEEVSWSQIRSIEQITYCTRDLWRIRVNEPKRSAFFFSKGKGMNDFLSSKVKLVTSP
jgi:hypothetical protein